MRSVVCLCPDGHTLNYRAKFDVAAWAEECERRLLQLHCGVHMPKDRHYAFADRVVKAENITSISNSLTRAFKVFF